MLSLSSATRVFVALEPVDMRQSFNGLYARVQTVLQQEPTSGHWFVFTNRSRNRLKILLWDGYGNIEIMGRPRRPAALLRRKTDFGPG